MNKISSRKTLFGAKVYYLKFPSILQLSRQPWKENFEMKFSTVTGNVFFLNRKHGAFHLDENRLGYVGNGTEKINQFLQTENITCTT